LAPAWARICYLSAKTRAPDAYLGLQSEAASQFDAEEKRVLRSLPDGVLLKHEARR
jgi:hypothetical protein